MRKVTTKFLILVFAGLFCLTVPFSAASAKDDSKARGAHGISLQDAGQFLDGKISGAAEVQRLLSNSVVCGEKDCNLNKSVCMARAQKDENNTAAESPMKQYLEQHGFEYEGGMFADALFNGTKYEYACIKLEDQNKYTEKGWFVYKQKQDDSKDIEKCYNAKQTTRHVKRYCIKAISGKVEVKAADNDREFCEVIPVRWYNNTECRFCALLGGAYKVADTITETSRSKLASSFAVLVALGLLIWIAMKTLIFVSSMTKQDAAKYITEMIKQSYKFMIAFFALMFYDDIFLYIILPLLKAGIAFGNTFVSVGSISERFNLSGDDYIAELLALADDELQHDYLRNKNNMYYDFATYVEMENLAYNVNAQYALLQSIGGSLVCLGLNYMSGRIELQLGLGIACVIYGTAFSAFGFFLCMAFVFYLFDAVVQLGIVGGLLPFLVASWPFKITSKYTSTGFKMLLNSVFTFMMIGVAVTIGMELIKVAVTLNTNPETAERYIGSDVNFSSGTDLKALADAVDNIDTVKLQKMVNILSVGFCLFMFANIMGFLLISRMSELVNRFAGGGMKGSAPMLATMAASTMKGMATKLAAPTVNATKDWAKKKGTSAAKWTAKKAAKLPGGTLRLAGKGAKWIDNKTGNVVSNKANQISSAVENKVKNSSVVQKTKKASKWLANSKVGKFAKAVSNEVGEVRRELGYLSKKEREEGMQQAQREVFEQKDTAGNSKDDVKVGSGNSSGTQDEVKVGSGNSSGTQEEVKVGSGKRPNPKDMD